MSSHPNQTADNRTCDCLYDHRTCTWVIPFESDDRNHQIYSASAAQSFNGNLTVHLSAKHKDEFGLLCDGVNDTVEHMKSLILDVNDVSQQVGEAAIHVAEASEHSLKLLRIFRVQLKRLRVV